MGGIGSGRYRYSNANDTTNKHRTIDIRRWQRDDLIKPGHSFSWQWIRGGEVISSIHVSVEMNCVTFDYRHHNGKDDWKELNYPVMLNWTACNLGGQRPWFICPSADCDRRVAILYSGNIFACRHCYRLAYQSQRENFGDRATRKAEKIRARLGWKAGILNDEGLKPKGMHWRTFQRLYFEHHDLVLLSLADAAARFGRDF